MMADNSHFTECGVIKYQKPKLNVKPFLMLEYSLVTKLPFLTHYLEKPSLIHKQTEQNTKTVNQLSICFNNSKMSKNK